jgi:hypothetical protein
MKKKAFKEEALLSDQQEDPMLLAQFRPVRVRVM